MDIGEASVAHVEKCLQNEFIEIFGQKTEEATNEPSHILNKVEWFESTIQNEVYAVLVIEPIYKSCPNNMICLCPPFNTSKYTE